MTKDKTSMKHSDSSKVDDTIDIDSNWNYKRICLEFKNFCKLTNNIPIRINCDIIAFNDLLNDFMEKEISNCFDPISDRVVLDTGHYANLKIDGKWLEIWVSKCGFSTLAFI